MTSITYRWRIIKLMSAQKIDVEVQRVSYSDTRRVLRLSGAVAATLEFEARTGRVHCEGERVSPVVSLPGGFGRAVWEFSLPELGPTHRFRIEVEAVFGTMVTFGLSLHGVPIYEDRDLGRTIILGSQLPLSDCPLPVDVLAQIPDTLPGTVEKDTGYDAVEP